MQQLTINPELKSLIPPLTAEEFKQLETNVLAEGIREPIITWNGTIVDGHNRYELAQMYELPFKTLEMEFESFSHCMKWMAENQLGRRNLTDFVKGELMRIIRDCLREIGGVKYAETVGRPSKESLSILDNDLPKHNTRQIVADKLGWSETKLARFDVVDKKAPEQIKEKLRTGEVSINQVYQEIKKEEKAKVLSERKEREMAEANEEKKEVADFNVQYGQVWRLGRHTLICGSAYDCDKIEATAIITDPPYGIDYNPDWKKWDGSESDYKKIEGDAEEFDPRPFLNYSTVLMFGANYFTKHLPQGGWLCWDKRLRDELDEMVGSPFELAWFKSSFTKRSAIMIRVLHGGVVNADSVNGNNQKRFHPTQKPVVLMEEILKKVTKEKEVICDPFCGSGTTLIAAENTGRTCIAYEIEPSYCNVILSRYEQLTNEKPCLESKE